MGTHSRFVDRWRRAFTSTSLGRSLRRSQYRRRLQEKWASPDGRVVSLEGLGDWDETGDSLFMADPRTRKRAVLARLTALWLVIGIGLGCAYAHQRGLLVPWLGAGRDVVADGAVSLIRAARLKGDSAMAVLRGGLAVPAVVGDDGDSLAVIQRRLGKGALGILGVDPNRPETMLAAQIPKGSETLLEESMDVPVPPPVPVGAVDLPPNRVEPGVAGAVRKPVIIYHTHASETYREQGCNYLWEKYRPDPSLEYAWKDKPGVVTVGTELAKGLGGLGIPAVHSKGVNDYPVFSESYKKALPVVEGLLKEHPDAVAVLDIHRDGLVGKGSVASVKIGDRQVAPVFIVVTNDEFGLPHPGWKENYAFALSLEKAINAAYPGLCRGVDLRNDARWNQHVHGKAIILEIGSNLNTTREALDTAGLIASPLAAVINGD